MEEIKLKKKEIRDAVYKHTTSMTPEDLSRLNLLIQQRLFDFANFLESRIVLLYLPEAGEVETGGILKRCMAERKIVVLPVRPSEKKEIILVKIDRPEDCLTTGGDGKLAPDVEKCKTVPMECIDIALIPGLAFDEKGGRLGQGEGYYDRLIPDLPITTRKVALAYESMLVPQIPMEYNDKFVDIIITEDRTIYKI